MTGREPRYYLNPSDDGLDVIHRDPVEECNVDQIKGRVKIDALTADAMLARDQARACRHCIPQT